MMCKCVFLRITAVLLISVFLFSSCSYEEIKHIVFESAEFETIISVNFDSESDVPKFENQLNALGLTISSKSTNEGAIEYHLCSHYMVNDNYWDLLCETNTVCIVNMENELMLQPENINHVYFDGTCLNVFVDREYFEKYDNYDINHSSLKINDSIYEMYPLVRENNNDKYIEYIEARDVSKSILVKFAISCVSEPFVGDVSISVTQSAKRVV